MGVIKHPRGRADAKEGGFKTRRDQVWGREGRRLKEFRPTGYFKKLQPRAVPPGKGRDGRRER